MKVICQNCFEILADRNPEENTLTFDPAKFPSIVQALNKGQSLLTISCNKCGCMVQVKV